MRPRPRIVCPDGFSLSVQASFYHYCTPRDDYGPYYEVEVGFPSECVDEFMPYIDGINDDPTKTVYGYVPIDLVAKVLQQHGMSNSGIAAFMSDLRRRRRRDRA